MTAGCGGSTDANGEAKPSGFQIAKAVLTSLLSNSVEAEPAPAPVEPTVDPIATTEDLAALASNADVPQTCVVPYNGPVTIIKASSLTAFARGVDDRPRARIVYETEDTAIWEDGRVLTTDVENVGTHLNAVGWASNPMQIMGAGARPGGSRQNLGWASSTSSFKNSNSTKKRKRRRRG